MEAMIARFVKDEQGLETIEYGIMLALIVVALIGLLAVIGGKVLARFQAVNAGL